MSRSLVCRGCREEFLDGIGTFEDGVLIPGSVMCTECIEADAVARENPALTASGHTVRPEPTPLPQPGEMTAAFIERLDPALGAWANRSDSTEDIRMAMAYGELLALHALIEINRSYHHGASVEHVIGQHLAGYAALRRRRDSSRFVHILERHMKSPDEGGPDGYPPAA